MENTQAYIDDHKMNCDRKRKEFEAQNISGPWMSEPDRVEFDHAGFKCLLVRNHSLFHWCGYVGVDKTHAASGKKYDDVDVNVHGGLTYGEPCSHSVCHITKDEDNLFWLGFDCAHSGDLAPAMDLLHKTTGYKSVFNENSVYRDVEWVKDETKHLAEQLSKYAA